MSIEEKIRNYRHKVQQLNALEQQVMEALPDHLWESYHNLKDEIESDKSVIQKSLKEQNESVEVDGLLFKLGSRTRTVIPESFMYTAQDLGHLDTLVDLGVITGVSVNDAMLERLPPELAGIYSNLVERKEYKSLTWPKGADK